MAVVLLCFSKKLLSQSDPINGKQTLFRQPAFIDNYSLVVISRSQNRL